MFSPISPVVLCSRRKKDYIDLTGDNTLKRKFNLENPAKFWILLNDKYPTLKKKALQMVIPFATSYLCKVGFSALVVITTKYRSRMNVEREMRITVSKLLRLMNFAKISKPAHHINIFVGIT